MSSIHKFKVEGIRGEGIDFAAFKGKKLMLVNVASACGYTPQYRQLQELYAAFQYRLAIVGFRCCDFGGQEPGTNEEISQFCTSMYGVSFPLAAKARIKSAACPVYEWLTAKELNGVMDSEASRNFHKSLLDEAGRLQALLPSATSPQDVSILEWLAAD